MCAFTCAFCLQKTRYGNFSCFYPRESQQTSIVTPVGIDIIVAEKRQTYWNYTQVGNDENTFFVSADKYFFNLGVTYQVTWDASFTADSTQYLLEFVDKNGLATNPRMISPSAGFAAGNAIQLSDLFAISDMPSFTLDDPNPQNFGAGELNVYRRVSGAVLVVTLTYSNTDSWSPFIRAPTCKASVSVVPRQWGYRGAEHAYASYPASYTRIESNVVSVRFRFAGSLAKFDFFVFVQALLSGVVLLSVVTTLLDFVGEKLLSEPDRIKFRQAKYRDMVNELKMAEMAGANVFVSDKAEDDDADHRISANSSQT
jgi:hypothetical protein